MGDEVRLLFAATLCVTILATPFFGDSVAQSMASLVIFHVVGGVAVASWSARCSAKRSGMQFRDGAGPGGCWIQVAEKRKAR